MRFYPRDKNYEPLGHVGRVPVYVTTIIAVLYVVGMLVTTMLESARVSPTFLIFSPDTFYHRGFVWQALTCTFVNGPNFFFLFGVFCFYFFALDIERFLGRVSFLKLYALTLFTPPVVASIWYLLHVEVPYAGLNDTLVSMFIAFATLYPNVEFFGWVPVKYVAFACLAVACLEFFPGNDWPGLSVLLAECAASFGYMRYVKQGGSVELPDLARKLNPFRRRARFRVLPSPVSSASPRSTGGSVESVDAILDKIAKSGFSSLTSGERDQLDKASKILIKKDPGRNS